MIIYIQYLKLYKCTENEEKYCAMLRECFFQLNLINIYICWKGTGEKKQNLFVVSMSQSVSFAVSREIQFLRQLV